MKSPMLRWFHALMPKEDSFFGLFDAHAQTLVAGAEALRDLLQGSEAIPRRSPSASSIRRRRPTPSPATCCWRCAAASSPPSTGATSRS